MSPAPPPPTAPPPAAPPPNAAPAGRRPGARVVDQPEPDAGQAWLMIRLYSLC